MKGQIEKIRQYIEAEIQESVETEQNKYLRILKKANPHDLEWMNEYGKEVTESEKETAVFYFSYPKEKICRMAEHITDAFFHGFTSQKRARRKEKGSSVLSDRSGSPCSTSCTLHRRKRITAGCDRSGLRTKNRKRTI